MNYLCRRGGRAINEAKPLVFFELSQIVLGGCRVHITLILPAAVIGDGHVDLI